MFKRITVKLFVLSLLLSSGLVSAESISVTHPMGDTVLTEVPARVVVLGMDSLDALDTLGIEPVGVVKSPIPPYLSKYKADKYTSVGSLFEPDFEAIYMLKPDLIIVSNRSIKAYDELVKIAPTVVFMADSTKFWETTTSAWRMLGKAFAKEQQVESIIADQKTQIEQLKQANLSDAVDALVVMKNGGNLTTFGEKSRYSAIFNLFGFKPAALNDTSYQHGDLVSFEYIAKINPQYMLVLDRDAAIGKSAQSAQQAFNNPLINKLDVYKNNHIHYLNASAWYISASGIQATQLMIDDMKALLAP